MLPLLHHRQRLEFFGIIFASGTWTVCIKILGNNSKGFWGIVQVKYKGYEKLAFQPISRFISKTVQDTAIVTMEDERNLYAIYRVVPLEDP